MSENIFEKNQQEFLEICLSLSSEKDREKLLSDILDKAMDFNHCDAGTLYLLEDDGLHFCRMVTKSAGIRQGGHGDPITLPPVPLKPEFVCSYAVMKNETVHIDSVRSDERFDFSGPKKYDEMTGYFTGTMCVVPLANDKNETIGAIQLINALDENGNITGFDKEAELLTGAMASLSAISLTNMQYSEQITGLLDSLVSAMSTAIDQRTPYNANHTRNMVKYGEKFLDWLEKTENPMAFDENKRKAFIMSVWLHDVGKMVVPLEVMDKDSRLGPGVKDVLTRFRIIKLLTMLACEKGCLPKDFADNQIKELDDAAEFVERINKAGFLPDADLERVQALAAKVYTDENGQLQPWITAEEAAKLSIRKGTLSDEERRIMESHVVLTGTILESVAFPKQYTSTPVWAAAHHELLNGKGYPNHLTAQDIPGEVRLLTILDVFDALTARDRPYKPPMPIEKALSILHSMADEGGLDQDILKLFEESRAWEE